MPTDFPDTGEEVELLYARPSAARNEPIATKYTMTTTSATRLVTNLATAIPKFLAKLSPLALLNRPVSLVLVPSW